MKRSRRILAMLLALSMAVPSPSAYSFGGEVSGTGEAAGLYAGESIVQEDPAVLPDAEESDVRIPDAPEENAASDAALIEDPDAQESEAVPEGPERASASAIVKDPAELQFYPQSAALGTDLALERLDEDTAGSAAGETAPKTLTGNNIYNITFGCDGKTYETTQDLSKAWRVSVADLVATLEIPGTDITYSYCDDDDGIVTIEYDEANDDMAMVQIAEGFGGTKEVIVEMDMETEYTVSLSMSWVMPEPESERESEEPEPPEPETSESETKASESETSQSESESESETEPPAPEPEKVLYRGEDGKLYGCRSYQKLSELSGTRITNGWFLADKTIDLNRVTVSGTAYVIVRGGTAVNLSSLEVATGAKLTVYGENKGKGTFQVTGKTTVTGQMNVAMEGSYPVSLGDLSVTENGILLFYDMAAAADAQVGDVINRGRIGLLKGGAADAQGSFTFGASILNYGRLEVGGWTADAAGSSIENKGTLVVSGGTLTGGDRYELVYNTGVMEITGGVVTGKGSLTSSAITQVKGTVTMSGGSIEGSNGSGITVSGGSFAFSGGEIRANARNGVQAKGGITTMTGGSVSENKVYGVLVSGESSSQKVGGTFAMRGGSITKNAASGVRLESVGVLQMQEAPVVQDNNTGGNGEASDVRLGKGKVITITGKLTGGKVGIRSDESATETIFTNNYSKFNNSAAKNYYFFSNEAERRIHPDLINNEAALLDNRAIPYVNAQGGRSWCASYRYVRSWQEGSEMHTWGTDWYVVDQYAEYDNKRIDIVGDVNLILCDGAKLYASDGIHVTPSGSLTIWCQDKGSGMLQAYCDGEDAGEWAGIGGNKGDDYGHGNITIYGGTIWARGGKNSAGIGCGPDGKGKGVIKIYGGYISATGGSHGAGIGGGLNRGNRPVYIYGGTIWARGGEYGAGIGGGARGSQDNPVYIYGGTVKAYGGTDAAGIGGGEEYQGGGNGNSVYVYGGDVYAEGDDNGAGIGGGEDGNGGDFYYYGGTVTAKADSDGVDRAIGRGKGGDTNGSIYFKTDAKVFYGSSWTLATYMSRDVGCRYYQVRIEPCDHPGVTYTHTRDTHSYSCAYCGRTTTEPHDGNNLDTVAACRCGYAEVQLIPTFFYHSVSEDKEVTPKAFSVTLDQAGKKTPSMRHGRYAEPVGTTFYLHITPPDDMVIERIDVANAGAGNPKLISSDASTGKQVYQLTTNKNMGLEAVSFRFGPAPRSITVHCDSSKGRVELSTKNAKPGQPVMVKLYPIGNVSQIGDIQTDLRGGYGNYLQDFTYYNNDRNFDFYTYSSALKAFYGFFDEKCAEYEEFLSGGIPAANFKSFIPYYKQDTTTEKYGTVLIFPMPERNVNISVSFGNSMPWKGVESYVGALRSRATYTYSLNDDLVAQQGDSSIVVPKGATFYLTLNGYTVNRAAGTRAEKGSAFTVYGNLVLKKSGTITGGNQPNGGGILVKNGGTVTIEEDVTISGNQADLGGGIYVEQGGTVTFQKRGVVSYNRANRGGGIYVEQGGTVVLGGTNYNARAFLTNNTAIQGGGLYNDGGTVKLQCADITDNTATGMGGGVFHRSGQLTLGYGLFSYGEICDNTASVRGDNLLLGRSQTFTMNGMLRNEKPIGISRLDLFDTDTASAVVTRLRRCYSAREISGALGYLTSENPGYEFFDDGTNTRLGRNAVLTVYSDIAGKKVLKEATLPQGASIADWMEEQKITISKEGYTFAGWTTFPKTDGDYTYAAVVPESGDYCLADLSRVTMPADGYDLYPVLIPPQVEVHVDPGAGELPERQPRSFTMPMDSAVDMTLLEQAQRAGYALEGWYSADGMRWSDALVLTPAYVDKDKSGKAVLQQHATYSYQYYTLTLTAVWTVREVSVLYGESGESAGGTMAKFGDTFRLPYTALGMADGKRLKGWQDRNGRLYAAGGQFAFTDWSLTEARTSEGGKTQDVLVFRPVLEDIPVYRVTFDTDGGSYVAPVYVREGSSADRPADPVRTGYTFAGWYTGDGREQNFPIADVQADIALTAQWTRNSYTLTFDAGEGRFGTGENASTKIEMTIPYREKVNAPKNPQRGHYRFTGWSPAALPVTMPAADLTYRALWTPLTYEIVFDANGGSFDPAQDAASGEHDDTQAASTTVTWNEDATQCRIRDVYYAPVSEPAAPAREGYAFAGWSTDKTSFQPEDTPAYMPDTAPTWYAIWKRIQDTPAAPTVLTKQTTDRSLTVAAVIGQAYSIDGGKTWQIAEGEELTFTGLAPATTYEIVTYKPGSESLVASGVSAPALEKTDRIDRSAPEQPGVVAARTQIEVSPAIEGQSYSIDGGESWVSPDRDGKVIFTGLEPDTRYSIVTRYDETDLYKTSPVSAPTAVYTKKTLLTGVSIEGTAQYGQVLHAEIAPQEADAPITYRWVRYASSTAIGQPEEIPGAAAAAYTPDAHDIGKVLEVRVTQQVNGGEDVTVTARTAAVVKADGPAAPTVSAQPDPAQTDGETGIVITTPVSDGEIEYEYRLENGAWQESASFAHLMPDTVYTVYARVKETATHEAGAAGRAKVRTQQTVAAVYEVVQRADGTWDASASTAAAPAKKAEGSWSIASVPASVADAEEAQQFYPCAYSLDVYEAPAEENASASAAAEAASCAGETIHLPAGSRAVYVYYARKSYDLTFRADIAGTGSDRQTFRVRYGADLSGWADTADESRYGQLDWAAIIGEGYTFAGWTTVPKTDGDYSCKAAALVGTDHETTKEYTLTNLTGMQMPGGDLTLYPVLLPYGMRIHLDLGAIDQNANAVNMDGWGTNPNAASYEAADSKKVTMADLDATQYRSFITDNREALRMTKFETMTRPGYVFDGWYTSDGQKWQEGWGLSPVYADRHADGSYVMEENASVPCMCYVLTLTAHWAPLEIRAIFGDNEETQTVALGGSMTLPTVSDSAPDGRRVKEWLDSAGNAYRPGEVYRFTDWSLAETAAGSDGTQESTLHFTPVLEDIPVYTVTFDSAGGSYVADTQLREDKRLAKPDDPTRTGYTFAGWENLTTGPAGEAVTFPLGDLRSDVTLRAIWNINSYTITFDAGEGEFRGGPEGVTYNKKQVRRTVSYESALSDPGVPVRMHYAFAGWTPALPDTMPARNLTLHAVWEPLVYAIAFDANGGSFDPAQASSGEPDSTSAQVIWNTGYTRCTIQDVFLAPLSLPEAPTRALYTFSGWTRYVGSYYPGRVPTYMPDTCEVGKAGASVPVWYAIWKKNQGAPRKPEIWREKTTDTTITVLVRTGQEYSIDGGETWILADGKANEETGAQEGQLIFTGLSCATEYSIITRMPDSLTMMASDWSEASVETTDKAQQSAPEKPGVIASRTQIEVSPVIAGQSYSIDGGTTWIGPNEDGQVIFTGLTPDSAYSILARADETDTHYASPASEATAAYTTKTRLTGVTIDGTAKCGQTLTAVIEPQDADEPIYYEWVRYTGSGLFDFPTTVGREATYEVQPADLGKKLELWVEQVAIDGHNVTVKVKTAVVTKADGAPAPTVQAKPDAAQHGGETGIVVTAPVSDKKTSYEYRLEGGAWQDSPSFANLTPDTAYTVYVRAKETAGQKAGAAGSAAVRTEKNIATVYEVLQNADGTWDPTAANAAALTEQAEERWVVTKTPASAAASDRAHFYARAYSFDAYEVQAAAEGTSCAGETISLPVGTKAVYIYYARSYYDLTFYADIAGAGADLQTFRVLYGADLSGWADEKDTARYGALDWDAIRRAGYTFAGWTTTAKTDGDYSCKDAALRGTTHTHTDEYTLAALDTMTMPGEDLTLYPVLIPDGIRVHLDLGAVDANQTTENMERWENPNAAAYAAADPDGVTAVDLVASQYRSFITNNKETLRTTKFADMSRPGYDFAGWYTSDGIRWQDDWGLSPVYADRDENGAYVTEENADVPCSCYVLTLTAHWTPKVIDVVFGANPYPWTVALGGTVIILPSSVDTPDGQRLIGWKDKSGQMHALWEHFVFTDWSLTETTAGSDGTQASILKFTPVYEDIPVYSVTFDSAGGTYVPDVSMREGMNVEQPGDPERVGYRFTGWYTEDGALQTFPIQGINGNITLTAKWEKRGYNIVYSAGEGYFETVQGNRKTLGMQFPYEARISSVMEPVRAHYRFMGWMPALPDTMPAYNLIEYAIWAPRTYAVAFDANGGRFTADASGAETSGTDSDAQATSAHVVWNDARTVCTVQDVYQAPVSAPSAPARDGYAFAGWTTNAQSYRPEEIPAYMPDTAPTWYAIWKQIQETPERPEILADKTTDTTITVKTVTGQAYSIDGGKTWVLADGKANPETGALAGELVFTGLTRVTDYSIVTRRPGSESLVESGISEPAEETTKKSAQAAPEAPTLMAGLDTLEVVPAAADQEYSIDGGRTWQRRNADGRVVFTGLDSDTQYTVQARRTETDTHYASSTSETAQYTAKVLLTELTIEGEAVFGETLTAQIAPEEAEDVQVQWLRIDPSKISADDGEPIENADGLTYVPAEADIGMLLLAVAVQTVNGGENVTKYAVTSAVEKADGPSAPAVRAEADASQTDGETGLVVMAPVSDAAVTYEYRLEDGDWQDTASFAELTPDTVYTVYARVKETATRKAGAAGSASVRTKQTVAAVYEVLQNADGTWAAAAQANSLEAKAEGSWTITEAPVSAAGAEQAQYDPVSYSLAQYAAPETDAEAPSCAGETISLPAGTRAVYIYYARKAYDLTFWADIAGAGSEKKTFRVLYGAPLAGWADADDPDHYGKLDWDAILGEEETFAGWTLTAKTDGAYSCKKAALAAAGPGTEQAYRLEDLSAMTMPGENLTLYPVLIPYGMRIHLDLGAVDANEDAVNMEDWENPNAASYLEADPEQVTAVDLNATQHRSFVTDNKEALRMTKFADMNRPGYLFDGWYTSDGQRWQDGWGLSPVYADRDADGSYVMEENEAVPCSCYVLTLTARWVPKEITAVFGENAGTQTVSLGKAVTMPVSADNTEDGYRLRCWKDKKGQLHAPGEEMCFADWSLTQRDGAEDSLRFTPVFEEIPVYSVYFDSNGGTFVETAQVREGADVEKPEEDPARTGYAFAGWYRDLNGAEEAFPIRNVQGSFQLTAKWTPKSYAITFDAGAGSFGEAQTMTKTFVYGRAVAAPDAPARAHYTFAGWSPALPETMPAGDLTVTALWAPRRYEIAFDADGGRFAPDAADTPEAPGTDSDAQVSSADVIWNEAYTVCTIQDVYQAPVSAPSAPTRDGYVFSGWTRTRGTYQAEETPAYMPDTAPTWYAIWKKMQETPAVPEILTDKTTDTAITVKAVTGQEYSIDGGKTWVPADGRANAETGALAGELVFTGLARVTDYSIVTRRPGSETQMPSALSEAATETTKKSGQAAPEAPKLVSGLDTLEVVPAEADQEYSIDGGKTWQKRDADGRVVFAGLDSDAQYTVQARRAETATHYASPAAETAQYTAKLLLTGVTIDGAARYGQTLTAQLAPEEAEDVQVQWLRIDPSKISSDDVEQYISDMAQGTAPSEEEIAEALQELGEPIDGADRLTYVPAAEDIGSFLLAVAVQTVNGGTNVTKYAATSIVEKADAAAPGVQAEPEEDTVLVVTAPAQETVWADGIPVCVYEYSLDQETWQETPRFAELAPDTVYIVYARTKETATQKAGAAGSVQAATGKTTAQVYEVIQSEDGTWSSLRALEEAAEGTLSIAAHPTTLEETEQPYFSAAGWSTDAPVEKEEEWTPTFAGEQVRLPAGTREIYVYYARDTYSLTFYQDIAGASAKAGFPAEVGYGASLAPWGSGKNAAQAQKVTKAGYTFLGWTRTPKTDGDYSCKAAALIGTDHQTVIEYELVDFADLTMPAEDQAFYPVLIPDGMRIHLDTGAIDAWADETNMEGWTNPKAASYTDEATPVYLDATQHRSFITNNKETLRTTKFADMSRPGFTFDGWYTSDGLKWQDDWGLSPVYADRDKDGEPVREVFAPVPCTCYVLTLTARWTPVQIDAVFGENAKTQTVSLGGSVTLPASSDSTPEGKRLTYWLDPAGNKYRPGGDYLFTDWALAEEDPDNGSAILRFTAEYEDIPVFEVTFDTQGGSAVAPLQIPEGESAQAPAEPVRTGYDFDGWLLDGQKVTFPLDDIRSDLHLQAAWTACSYTLTLEGNGGSFAGEPSLTRTYDYEEAVAVPEEPVRQNYRFTGWTPALPETMPACDLTIRAVWEPEKYRIAFSANAADARFPEGAAEQDGWSGSETDLLLTDLYGAPVHAPEDPVREGYTFIGWSSESDSFAAVQIPAYMPDTFPTFYAFWKENQETPEAPVVVAEKTTDTSITVQAVTGQEYSIDGGQTWVPAGGAADEETGAQAGELVFTGLSRVTTYEIITRLPGSDTRMPSEASAAAAETTKKSPQAAPDAPGTAASQTEIEISPVTAGQAYSIDGGQTWVTPGADGRVRFTGLAPDTEYQVTARWEETDWTEASPASDPRAVKTKAAEEVPDTPVVLEAAVYEVLQGADGSWTAPAVLNGKAQGSYQIGARPATPDAAEAARYNVAGYAYGDAAQAGTLPSGRTGAITPAQAGDRIPVPEEEQVIYVFYERRTYDLTFCGDIAGSGADRQTIAVPWDASLEGWKEKTVGQEGYTFAGWSLVPKTDGDYSCKAAALIGTDHQTAVEFTLADLAGMTMPDAALTFYPVLIPDGMQIHLDLGAIDAWADETNMEGWTNPNAASYTDTATPVYLDATQHRSFITENREALRLTKFETMTRPGYTFDGWYTSGGLKWQEDWGLSPVYADADADGTPVRTAYPEIPCSCYVLTLTAHWVPRTIEAVFGTSTNTQQTALGQTVTLPAEAAEAAPGETVAYWLDKRNNRYAPGETVLFDDWSLTEDDTLRFTPVLENTSVYTIMFDTDGGSYIERVQVKHGNKLQKPEDPVRLGYTFAGWTLDGAPVAFPLADITSDLTLKAAWTGRPYTITLDAGSGSFAGEDEENAQRVFTIACGADVAEAIGGLTPVRAHYSFKGWVPSLPETMPARSLSVMAVWEPVVYELVFDATDGTFADEGAEESGASSTVRRVSGPYGSPVTPPADPVYKDHAFSGWDKEVPKYMPDAAPVSDGSQGGRDPLVFYAQWADAPDAPPAPEAAGRTDTTITILCAAGQEYSIDGGQTWVTPGEGETFGDAQAGTMTFTNLEPDTAYQIVTRYAATETQIASLASEPCTVTTRPAIEPEKPGQEEPAREETGGTDVHDGKAGGQTVTPDALRVTGDCQILDNLSLTGSGSSAVFTWGQVAGAQGYDIYLAYCGKKNKVSNRPVMTVRASGKRKARIKKLNGAPLQMGRSIKGYVVAWVKVNGRKVRIARSVTMHVALPRDFRHTNVKKVKVTNTAPVLRVGQTLKLKPKAVLMQASRKQLSDKHTAKFRYRTTDAGVAQVGRDGTILAVGAGTCEVYVIARNGRNRKIRVTVE